MSKSAERTSPRKITLALIGALALALALALAIGRHAFSAGAASPAPNAMYDPTLVAKGAWLAAIGNCNTCHTASNGRTFAG
ncbi:MAG TPA: cytochrome c, partial [Casimicrobiaceae bacterium]|nr:cytochrome c [Casimicrobiaceae bacterium]